ncbi:MAG: hypothetical protein V1837_07810 [Candidatus Woesearchaeota archaeon]
MTSLIACVSTGQGTWVHVYRLIKQENWDKVYIITNEFGSGKFEKGQNTEIITVDFNKEIGMLVEEIQAKLQGKITDFEVAVNIISGTGKEHTAIIAALIRLGLGIRFAIAGEQGITEV